MRLTATSFTRYVNLLVRHLEQQGVDCVPMLEAAGIDREVLKHPDGRLATQKLIDMFRCVAEQGGVQQEAGLLVGKMINMGVLGDLGRAMLACATAREALHCCAEFFHLIAPSYGMRINPGVTHCTLHFYPVRPWPYDMTLKGFDMILGAFDNLIAYMPPDKPPTYDVYFVHAAPCHEHLYRELTRARCHFGEPGLLAMRIKVANKVIDVPSPMRNLDELIEQRRRLTRQHQCSPGRGNWKDWVGMMLREAHELQPTQNQMAAVLGISGATLARHLQAEGTSFRKLANEVRHQRACQLLEAGSNSVTQISQHLGYENPGNFVRAFKAYSGCTPAEFARSRELV